MKQIFLVAMCFALLTLWSTAYGETKEPAKANSPLGAAKKIEENGAIPSADSSFEQAKPNWEDPTLSNTASSFVNDNIGRVTEKPTSSPGKGDFSANAAGRPGCCSEVGNTMSTVPLGGEINPNGQAAGTQQRVEKTD